MTQSNTVFFPYLLFAFFQPAPFTKKDYQVSVQDSPAARQLMKTGILCHEREKDQKSPLNN